MSAGELRVGQIVPIEFTIKDQAGAAVDLTGATSMVIKIENPNKLVVSRSAAFVNTGTDGKIVITTQSSDLTYKGAYRLQALVTLGGIVYPSDILEIDVYENIP